MSHKPGRRPSEGWSRKFAEQWDKLEELARQKRKSDGKENGTTPTRKPRSPSVKTKTTSETG